MSTLGDNDGTYLMWFDEAANAVDSVLWEEARERLALFFESKAETAAAGWAENRAEDLLCAMFSGVAS